jgi:hypothetical protein
MAEERGIEDPIRRGHRSKLNAGELTTTPPQSFTRDRTTWNQNLIISRCLHAGVLKVQAGM